jgi:hypothetical protein
MTILEYVYEPKVRLQFTEDEINVLKFLSEGHYDATCRSLSVPGRGAVINGLINSLEDGNADMILANREVQLLCKCCEMAALCEPRVATIGIRLHSELWRAIGKLGDEWERLNRAYEQKGRSDAEHS